MMKKTKLLWGLAVLVVTGVILVAADHVDAPGIAGSTADIADLYAFEPTLGSDNTVFAIDVQSNVMPQLAYGEFDEDVLIELNIDKDGDLVEDLVIQAIPRDGKMYFYGPVAPDQTGLKSQVMTDAFLSEVEIGTTFTTQNNIKLFAGPRQDPFFFDFFQFNDVVAGNAPMGFNKETAADTFNGANTLSLVMEIPNSILGATTAANALGVPVYKVWVTTNRKQ